MTEKGTATQMATAPTTLKVVEPQKRFERLNEIYNAISRRAFEIFESSGGIFGRDLENWLSAESEILHPVHVELEDSDGALIIRAEVPGFTTKDLEVTFEPRRVTISGRKEKTEERRKGTLVYTERCANEILRTVELAEDIEPTRATFTLKDGILELELPKIAKSLTTGMETKVA